MFTHKNLYKSFMLSLLSVGILLAVSSVSWMSVWVGMELNMFSFLALIGVNSKEGAMKYFLVQAFGSQCFILSFLLVGMSIVTFNILMLFALCLKVGAAPLHFWYPMVAGSLSWQGNMILSSLQKIIPLSMMSVLVNYHSLSKLFLVIIVASAFMGSIGGVGQSQIRKLMAYSSINHTSWILSGMLHSSEVWVTYFICYCVMSVSFMGLMSSMGLFSMNSLMSSQWSGVSWLVVGVSLLSLGGVPPFFGFFPKWMVLENLFWTGGFALSVLLILGSLVSIYFYTRVLWFYFSKGGKGKSGEVSGLIFLFVNLFGGLVLFIGC